MRRSHKKSRAGCLQCKRRHVKCDESRPVCLLCANSSRECSFSDVPAPAGGSTSSSSSPIPDIGSVQLPLTAASSDLSLPSPVPPALDAPLNLHHIELITHMMSSKDMFNFSFDVGDHVRGVSHALKTGLNAPYVLHQLLALSARHLAALYPARSAHYLHLATSLQTRAVSLFNAAALAKDGPGAAVNSSNCVAVVLFSSVLAHHVLADTLTRRDHGTLDAFLAHYVQAIDMTRGVLVVSTAAWPLLMVTEGGPTIAASAEFTMREGKGSYCDGLRDLVDRAAGLSGAEREACRRAVTRLQVGFDAVEEEGKEDSYRFQMIFAWTMMAPPEMAALLVAKRPEALVMLGYYALLLYYGRAMWQVRDAGKYLLGLILDHLSPEWHLLLEQPRKIMTH